MKICWTFSKVSMGGEILEEVVAGYRRVIALIELENEKISGCLQGELLDIYRRMLDKEVCFLEKQIRQILQHG